MGHSGMSNAAECLRFMIYTINLLMLICCFALIIACGVLLGKHEQLMELLGENTAWVVITAIMATAVIIFLVSLLGCCGAMKENTCMLKTYIGIMFTLLLILLVVAGLGYGYKDPARQTVYDHMEKKMMEYNPLTNSTITRFWDDMQSQVCCDTELHFSDFGHG
ncbi:unnamed protein product [Meganyctiphanes norvegica]|uniref:Tetraspanin n=1 Tax=Meganyctiphanes norvegica TaxID=48144 RepID=A0AAV2SQ76_MEGNR